MLLDLHNDLFTCGKTDEQIKECVIAAKKQNARVLYAVYNDGKKPLSFLIERAEFIKEITGGACTLENACYISESADNGLIAALFKAIALIKPLCASLCWNNKNAFASGCACEGGLTSAGKTCVRFFNRSKIALDLAHINEDGFYEGFELADKPLCTHSALYSVFPHRRNLKNEQIRLLLEKGGIFGLIGVRRFLCEKNKNAKQAFLNHVNEYLQLFGVKGLCLGSDFYGSDSPLCADGDYAALSEIANGLKKLGLNDGELKKVLYLNAAEFFGLAV